MAAGACFTSPRKANSNLCCEKGRRYPHTSLPPLPQEMEAGERGSCLTKSKNESLGPWRVSKAVEGVLLSKNTANTLRGEKGALPVANEGLSLALFYLELAGKPVALQFL